MSKTMKSSTTATFVAVEKLRKAARIGQLAAEIKEIQGMIPILEKQIEKWGKTMEESTPDDRNDEFSEYQIASRKKDHCLLMLSKQEKLLTRKKASFGKLSFSSHIGGTRKHKRNKRIGIRL